MKRSRVCLKTRDGEVCVSQALGLSLSRPSKTSLTKQRLRPKTDRLTAEARRHAKRFQALPKAHRQFMIRMVDLFECGGGNL